MQRHVVICGLGGGGSLLAELLARAGVERLTLVDGDRFEARNLSGQIGALVSTLGRFKAEVMAARLADAAPGINVRAVCRFLNVENGGLLLADADMVCDCVDNAPSKRILATWCRRLRKPYCTAGMSGSFGQIALFDPPEHGADMYSSYTDTKGRPSQPAEPVAQHLFAALQARAVLNWVNGVDDHTRNRVLFYDFALF